MKGWLQRLAFTLLSLLLITCAGSPPQKSEKGIDPGYCLACHIERTPGLFQAWVESKHAQNGVNCVTCHTDHEAAYGPKAMVFPDKCGECHAQQLDEFRKSRHSIAFERMRSQGEYLRIPQEIRSAFCERCHMVEKRCNSCHASHDFSTKAAKEPEACGNCHLGPDHPHKEMYESSLHGIVYKMTRDPDRAPRCITCHMPGGTHNTGFGIAQGPVGTRPTVVDLKENTIAKEEQERKREEMIQICTACHSRRFAVEQLVNADQVKDEAFKLKEKGKEAIREVEQEGLLYPSLAERPPHPTEGRKLVLADPQLYVGTSYIERLFFTMFKFHNIRVWKSGYHFSPAYIHRYGWSEMQMDLIEIQDEAKKLKDLFKGLNKSTQD